MFLCYLGDNLVVGEESFCLLSEGVPDLGEGGVGPELPRNIERGTARLRHQLGVCLQRVVTSVYQLGEIITSLRNLFNISHVLRIMYKPYGMCSLFIQLRGIWRSDQTLCSPTMATAVNIPQRRRRFSCRRSARRTAAVPGRLPSVSGRRRGSVCGWFLRRCLSRPASWAQAGSERESEIFLRQ